MFSKKQHFHAEGLGRLLVNCQHHERKGTRNVLYLAGDKEMSQGVTWSRKVVSSDNAMVGYRKSPEALLQGVESFGYFRPLLG